MVDELEDLSGGKLHGGIRAPRDCLRLLSVGEADPKPADPLCGAAAGRGGRRLCISAQAQFHCHFSGVAAGRRRPGIHRRHLETVRRQDGHLYPGRSGGAGAVCHILHGAGGVARFPRCIFAVQPQIFRRSDALPAYRDSRLAHIEAGDIFHTAADLRFIDGVAAEP
ncbi:hypothetical protein SDC9_135908 [bioreactor metagenome]|uniref:Uncharacterized protein n=1 Tax=bioreactor metagenome TaxID=1076179 RepID=A0A645DH58_9ZZZZ